MLWRRGRLLSRGQGKEAALYVVARGRRRGRWVYWALFLLMPFVRACAQTIQ
jgi:hypothetical protein